HTHPRSGGDNWSGIGDLQTEATTAQVCATVGHRDAERLTEPARSAREIRLPAAPRTRDLHPFNHLPRAQQDPAAGALPVANDVQTPVHAVTEVDVGVAGRSEHHRVLHPGSAERMAGGIIRPS